MHNFYVISYDIADDERRRKVSKCLEDYGDRVQYSVFEFLIDEVKVNEIKEKLEKIIDKRQDSIRIYTLCNACLKKTNILGEGELTKDIEIYII